MKPEMIEEIADRFKALSEPTRLSLLFKLVEGEMTVSNLAAFSGTSMANVSKHLTFMRRAGIVTRRKSGNQVFYAVRNQKIFDLCQFVHDDIDNRFTSPSRTKTRKRKRSSESPIPAIQVDGRDTDKKEVVTEQPSILGLSDTLPVQDV